MKIAKNILQTNRESKHWVEKNWFFATTVFIVLLNIILFAAAGHSWGVIETNGTWDSTLNFNAMFHSLFNSFSHWDWRHVLLNMLCFVAVGSYLERKYGSIKLLLIILALGFFTAMAVSTFSLSVNWRGFSGINYGLYFFLIIDFLFSLRKTNRAELIYCLIILGLIVLAFCYNKGASFPFTWYPKDLISNIGHYSSAVVGIIFGLTVQLSKMDFHKNKISI